MKEPLNVKEPVKKTPIKDQVLEFLNKNPYDKLTPTQIGMALGKSYSNASSSVNSSLKALVKSGDVTRCKIDGKVLYQIHQKNIL